MALQGRFRVLVSFRPTMSPSDFKQKKQRKIHYSSTNRKPCAKKHLVCKATYSSLPKSSPPKAPSCPPQVTLSYDDFVPLRDSIPTFNDLAKYSLTNL
ncbi:hypothetical protein DSO57_1026641 [Entomophthora muscae]|uniref:Uncharacterized protein n=1 Tax=Entomophthora muscae TaxID=34485 RepID=A0ACC2SRQ0_9FUNG|nr:hypothetical protein DSO57_1026641 [Entomophthora muscae]